jgi:hypothetical protein
MKLESPSSVSLHPKHLSSTMTSYWAKAARALASKKSMNKLFSELPLEESEERSASEKKIREFLVSFGKKINQGLAEDMASDDLILWCYIDAKGALQVVHSLVNHNFGFFKHPIMMHVGVQSDSFDESAIKLVKSSDSFTRTKTVLTIVGDDVLQAERWYPDSVLESPLAIKNAKNKAHTLDSLHFTGCADHERPRFVYLPKLFPFRVGQKVPIGSKLKDIKFTSEDTFPWGFRVWVEGMRYCWDYNNKMLLNARDGNNKMFTANPRLLVEEWKVSLWNLHIGAVITDFTPVVSDLHELEEAVTRKIEKTLIAWCVHSTGAEDDPTLDDCDDTVGSTAKRARVGEISDQDSP